MSHSDEPAKPDQMKIKIRKISDLIGAEYNPRQLTNDQHRHLTDSLKRFGMVDPVIVNAHADRKDIIVGGHQRLKVWAELGNDIIPTVEVDLDRDRERELNVRLNRNTGEWDWDVLANEFDVEELTDWGFSEDELQGFNLDDIPESNQIIDENELAKTENECPKCGFKW